MVGKKWNSCFALLYYSNSREPSPSQPLYTRAAINVAVQLSGSLFFAASSRASTRAPGPGRAIWPVTLLSTAGRSLCSTTLLVGWPWKMVVVNIVSAGHWGRRAAWATPESASLDSCECVAAPKCISSVKHSVQMDSQSLIGTEQQLRSLKALTSCHIQAQIAVFTESQVQSESLQQGRGAVVSIHTSFPLS